MSTSISEWSSTSIQNSVIGYPREARTISRHAEAWTRSSAYSSHDAPGNFFLCRLRCQPLTPSQEGRRDGQNPCHTAFLSSGRCGCNTGSFEFELVTTLPRDRTPTRCRRYFAPKPQGQTMSASVAKRNSYVRPCARIETGYNAMSDLSDHMRKIRGQRQTQLQLTHVLLLSKPESCPERKPLPFPNEG